MRGNNLLSFAAGAALALLVIAAFPGPEPTIIIQESRPITWRQGEIQPVTPVLAVWEVGGTVVARAVIADYFGGLYEYYGEGMAYAVESHPDWWTEIPQRPP